MSLKQARFHVEPVFNYRGDEVNPFFGEPDEHVERIVDWVKGCKFPQTYGCYTLWKVLHQQKRTDVVEYTVEAIEDELASLRQTARQQQQQIQDLLQRFECQEAQTQGLVGLTQAQDRSITNVREKLISHEKGIETIREQIAAQVMATVIEIECSKCRRFCGGECEPRRPFISLRY
jgi:hypothetical protein